MNNYPCNNVKVPISGWVNLHPFKAWCLQILPTIFDESMSYYECLCKLLDIMSATIDDVNLLGQEFVKLKEYVDNYFNNLDVQTEINNKLDEMAKNGNLARLVSSFFTPTPYHGNSLSIGGNFCKKSIFNNYTLIGYISQIVTGSNVDLSAENISLMAPGNLSYYYVLEEYLNNNPIHLRFAFLMLEPNDYNYNVSLIQEAITQIGNLINENGGLLYVIPNPTHILSMPLTDLKKNALLYALNPNTFVIPMTEPQFLMSYAENYHSSGEYLVPGGVTWYSRYIVQNFSNRSIPNSASYSFIDNANINAEILRVQSSRQGINVKITFLKLTALAPITYTMPLNIYDVYFTITDGSDIFTANITNNILSLPIEKMQLEHKYMCDINLIYKYN